MQHVYSYLQCWPPSHFEFRKHEIACTPKANVSGSQATIPFRLLSKPLAPFKNTSKAPVETMPCEIEPMSRIRAKHPMRLSNAFWSNVVSNPSVRKIYREHQYAG